MAVGRGDALLLEPVQGAGGQAVVFAAKDAALNRDVARRLWQISEELTGVRY